MVDAVTSETLREWINADGSELTIVDVRTPPEYDAGHLPGALSIPMNDLPARIGSLPLTDRVVFVCEVGAVSEQAARLFESYEAVDEDTVVGSLEDGIRAWDGPLVANE